MSSICFRGRRDNEYIDCSFFIKDGAELADVTNYHIGDSVSIIFYVSEHQAKSINELERHDIRAHRSGVSNEKWSGHIPFQIPDKRHSFAWCEVGTLTTLGSIAYLQAVSAKWEDIFLWICMDNVPEWADAEKTV